MWVSYVIFITTGSTHIMEPQGSFKCQIYNITSPIPPNVIFLAGQFSNVCTNSILAQALQKRNVAICHHLFSNFGNPSSAPATILSESYTCLKWIPIFQILFSIHCLKNFLFIINRDLLEIKKRTIRDDWEDSKIILLVGKQNT